MQAQHAGWKTSVEHRLQQIALGGIKDPISEESISPRDLQVEHCNFRETVSHGGVISRQRAVLLVLRRLIECEELPPWAEMRAYISEAVTPFAERLGQLIPRLRSSEYLPEPDHWLRGTVPNRDLRRIGLPPATFHAVICNEVLEHVEELVPSLRGLCEILTLDGVLLATVPFLYGQHEHLTKAIWRGEGLEPQIVGKADYHGNPVDEYGSLVYRYPGWRLLDNLKEAGFRDASIHTISSSRYGVLGEETPWVFVLVAKR